VSGPQFIDLHAKGFTTESSWLFVGGGFAVGAVLYYFIALLLDREGAAVRLPTRFREYAIRAQQKNSAEIIRLLSQGELLRHLPAEDIGEILPLVEQRSLEPGEVVFRAGEEGDALYIVARGKVDVTEGRIAISAELGPGHLGDGAAQRPRRTATIQTAVATTCWSSSARISTG
jgi:hypothetical protein